MASPEPPSWRRKLLVYFGLAHPEEGAPLPGAPSKSRYGQFVSPRLDQDVDELRRRLADLERRLR